MTDVARSLLGSSLYFVFIVLPVLGYVKMRGQTNKRMVLSIFAIWLLWSAINTPLHEGAHALAGVLVGMHVREGQFIQHFWQGDFVHGYVVWEPASVQQFRISTAGPYVADGLIVLLAWIWFPKRCTPFLGALLLSVTYLRSAFDVAVNYSADTVFGGKGDFDFLFRGYPRTAVHIAAVLIMLLSASGAALELLRVHRAQKTISAPAKVSVAG